MLTLVQWLQDCKVLHVVNCEIFFLFDPLKKLKKNYQVRVKTDVLDEKTLIGQSIFIKKNNKKPKK